MATSLKQKTLFGLIWSTIETFATQGIGFALGILIARFLDPSAFGTIAMASVLFAFARLFIDSGFTAALIRKPDVTESDLCTAFYFNIVIAFFASIIIALSAPFVADFYNLPDLTNIIRVASIGIFISSFSSVQSTLLTIRLNFKLQMYVSVISMLVSGCVGVYGAYSGWGVWALVIQGLCSSCLSVVLLWCTTKWFPRKPFSKESFKELFSFGSRMLATSVLGTIYAQVFTIFVGKVYSPDILGNYGKANQIASYPSSSLSGIIQRVTFPALSKIQNDEEKTERTYRQLMKMVVFIVFPAMLGLAAVAEPLILVLLTEKWAGAIPILQLLCFSLMWFPVHSMNLGMIQVKGRSDYYLRLDIFKKIIGVAILLIFLPLGIIPMCYGWILSSLISLYLNSYYVAKLIGVGFWKQMLDIFPVMIAALMMWASVLLSIQFVDNSILQLVLGVPLGAIIYLACAFLFRLEALHAIPDLYKTFRER